MPQAHWEHFHHGADIGVRGVGTTLAQAFEQTAVAMTAVITDPSAINETTTVDIALEEADPEYLLVDWLNQLVFLMATQRLLFARFRVHIADGRLQATAWGEEVDVSRHQPAVEVKGATLTELVVKTCADGWMAQCVVDV